MGRRGGLASREERRNRQRIFWLLRSRPARLLCWDHRLRCAEALPAIRSGHRRRAKKKRRIGDPVDRPVDPASLCAPRCSNSCVEPESGELHGSLELKTPCKEIEANAIAPPLSRWTGRRLAICLRR